MPNPVSIIVWRDARTDPPKGQLRGVFVEFENGKVWTAFANTLPCEGSPWDGYDDVRRWAEIPVVSDLTDDDVRRVRHCANVGLDTWGDIEAHDRFCAALGGEKPDSDGLYHDRIHYEPGRARGAKTVRTLRGEKEET